MTILAKIKEDYETLRNGPPGHRFRRYVDARKKRRSGKLSIRRVASNLLGVALVVIGVSIGWLPGPGGFLAFIGLALIAKEVPWIADVLDGFELGTRRTIQWCKSLICHRSKKCNDTNQH